MNKIKPRFSVNRECWFCFIVDIIKLESLNGYESHTMRRSKEKAGGDCIMKKVSLFGWRL